MKRAAAKIRLTRAAKLLTVTRMEIIDIAFDCADAGLFEATENRVRKMLALAIGSGEPMKSCISLSELEHMLEAHGFLIYEYLNPEAIRRRFSLGSADLRPFEQVQFILTVKKAEMLASQR